MSFTADMYISVDENTTGGVAQPPCTGPTSDALPKASIPQLEERSDTGVSTLSGKKHWYALRTTYGREKKAYDYIVEHGGIAFYPTITTMQVKDDKKIPVSKSRFSNLFFAYGTEEELKTFVYDNVNLPFLRFYYKHIHNGARIQKTPLIVPDDQIRSLYIICTQEYDDIIILCEQVEKFKTGETVRVIDGQFKGVTGVVARFMGQQRVGIVIGDMLTAITAYIPNAFLEKII